MLQTSCLTETFFSQALERAQYLDNYLKREGKPVGPLHGLPISIKDSFCVEGVQSTVGFVALLKDESAKKNSALVKMLLHLGAVLYVKTNIPQTMMVSNILEYFQRPKFTVPRQQTRRTISSAARSTRTTQPSQQVDRAEAKARSSHSAVPSWAWEQISQARSASPRYAVASTASSRPSTASHLVDKYPVPWKESLD
jgi:hypothetical protein